MLTDTRLRNLKPGDKLYKVRDREGLYVATPAGTISFRYDYEINGRYETITFGRYGAGGMTLAEARVALHEAKRLIAAGKSPAQAKARAKKKDSSSKSFDDWAQAWLRGYEMAESTRDMRRAIYERELKRPFGNKRLTEITDDDLRQLTDMIVDRGAPATAVHAREVVLQVYRWANERGQKVKNPAEEVRPSTIAKFQPRDRALSPEEIGLMYEYMDRIGTSPQFRAGAKLLLLTMVRKSELSNAKWSEVNFSEAVWTIPKERMKRRMPHNVYLSRQALDILVALKTFAGGSEYVLPSRYDTDLPMSSATFNQVLTLTYKAAQKDGKPLGKFGPHDLRRTASTLLHEAGYNTDWIEKCLAHEQKGVRAVYGIYKSEVVRARDNLLAMGRYPSIDAIRGELGNTGSKGTIHRYLKEIEEEEGGSTGARVAVSEAIQDLSARLAERLHQEADQRMAALTDKHKVEIAALNDAMAALRNEGESFRGQAERQTIELAAEKAAHADALANLQDERIARAQMAQRIQDMEEQLTKEEAHRVSLEEKHQHAREALEHFRTAAKEQREQDQRQFEQQILFLQGELRNAKETANAKQQALIRSHEDNARLSSELTHAHSELHRHDSEIRTLRSVKSCVSFFL